MAEHIFHGNIDINFYESQQNGLPLLMIHGGADRWQSLNPIIPELAEKYHIYAMDLRGHGKSGRSPGAYTLSDFALDIELFIAKQIKIPTVIFGHSLGGMIALMVAAKRPDLVKGLIIGDAPLNLTVLRNLIDSQREMANRYIQWLRTGQRGKLKAELKNEDQTETLFNCDPDMLSAQFDGFDTVFGSYDTKKLLPLVRCPLLIIRGNPTLGSLISDVDMKSAIELCPQLEQVHLADEGHALFATSATPLVSSMRSFIDKIEN